MFLPKRLWYIDFVTGSLGLYDRQRRKSVGSMVITRQYYKTSQLQYHITTKLFIRIQSSVGTFIIVNLEFTKFLQSDLHSLHVSIPKVC
jgi:hypothetical protein